MTETTKDIALEDWSPQEVARALEADEIVLIDVRTPQEFSFEHIEGALLMPLSAFRARSLPTQDGKRLVFHCGSGARSRRVAAQAAAIGLSPLAHMAGGFRAWKEAGLPYIAIDPATGGTRKVAP